MLSYSFDTDEDEIKSQQSGKKIVKTVSFVKKNSAPVQEVELEEDDL